MTTDSTDQVIYYLKLINEHISLLEKNICLINASVERIDAQLASVDLVALAEQFSECLKEAGEEEDEY